MNTTQPDRDYESWFWSKMYAGAHEETMSQAKAKAVAESEIWTKMAQGAVKEPKGIHDKAASEPSKLTLRAIQPPHFKLAEGISWNHEVNFWATMHLGAKKELSFQADANTEAHDLRILLRAATEHSELAQVKRTEAQKLRGIAEKKKKALARVRKRQQGLPVSDDEEEEDDANGEPSAQKQTNQMHREDVDIGVQQMVGRVIEALPILSDESVWGRSTEDPLWFYHFECGMYFHEGDGQLYARDADTGGWAHLGNVKPVTTPHQPSPPHKAGSQSHPRHRRLTERRASENAQEDEPWLPSPEDPEWLYNTRSRVYFHRREARYYRYVPEQGNWAAFTPPPQMLYQQPLLRIPHAPAVSKTVRSPHRVYPPQVFSKAKCLEVLELPIPSDGARMKAVEHAKATAQAELKMHDDFLLSTKQKWQHAAGKQYDAAHRLLIRQARGFAAQARQCRLQASRERERALQNQVMAEELAFRAGICNKSRKRAEMQARREAAEYRKSLQHRLETVGNESTMKTEQHSDAKRKKQRNERAEAYQQRAFCLPPIAGASKHASGAVTTR